MLIKTVEFSEFDGEPRQWKLDKADFGPINLIVGKNSTGKTRVLNVIRGLASLIAGERKGLFHSGRYNVVFQFGKKQYLYRLAIEQFQVLSEELQIEDEIVLTRSETGEGRIKAVELGRKMKFQTPVDQLAVVSRRDSVQHPFIEELYQWAKSVKHYLFGSEFGRNVLGVRSQEETDSTMLDKRADDPNQVLSTLKSGLEQFGDRYKQQILEDLKALGYTCTDVGLRNVSDYLVGSPQLLAIFVQEEGLASPTVQIHMSQGMFRALALAIQLNYTIEETGSACILVDDIGEGLDFSRARNMILLLIDKARQHGFQLFMTTNDRFVMNAVPLDLWSILVREGSVVHVFNKTNANDAFEEFEYVGLSNFDFFSSELFRGVDIDDDEKGE